MDEDTHIIWPQFIAWYNATLEYYRSPIEQLRFVEPGKKSQVQRLINEAGSKHLLKLAVINMAKSDFLNGRRKTKESPNGFIASFYWLFGNDTRIYEVAGGKYNNAPEEPPTADDLRRQRAEERERLAEQRREEAKRIEEEEAEKRERQREYDRAHAARGEELQRILEEIKLPPLRENEKSPKQRIFS